MLEIIELRRAGLSIPEIAENVCKDAKEVSLILRGYDLFGPYAGTSELGKKMKKKFHYNNKRGLDSSDIVNILQLADWGLMDREIAKRFKVDPSTVNVIRNHKIKEL